jgi:hypothetical protein
MKKYIILTCILALVFAGLTFVRAGTISETGISQKDLVRFLSNIVTIVNELKSDYNLSRGQLLNMSTSKGGLGSTGDVATARTTATVNYMINGVMYSLAASSSMTIPPTAAQSTPTYCYYLFSLDSNGKLYVTKGTEAASSGAATLPAVPENKAPFGAVLVYASSTAFTMGTSNLDTAVIPTPTWYDIGMVFSGSGASTDITSSDLTLVNP